MFDQKELQTIDCNFAGFKALKSVTLDNKYVLGKCIATGCFGKIFEV
jgi:hypothetical protein